MTLTIEELIARQECLAAAIIHVSERITELSEHAGFSPGKRLKAEVLLLLDGKELPPVGEPMPVETDEDDEKED